MRFERWEEWDDPYGIHLALFVGGEKFYRRLDEGSEKDMGDLAIARSFWEHGERLGDTPAEQKARLVDRCLAAERLWPEARELLPA